MEYEVKPWNYRIQSLTNFSSYIVHSIVSPLCVPINFIYRHKQHLDLLLIADSYALGDRLKEVQ